MNMLTVCAIITLFHYAAVDPHYPILVDRVPVRNSKPVMIWWHKQYRNDRVFAGGFQ